MAGGFDANTMLYGNWWGPVGHLGADDTNNRIIWCNYNYRNVPLEVTVPWHIADELTGVLSIPYIKPAVVPHANNPMFKTMEAIGGRAIISDTFNKGACVATTGWDALGALATRSTMAGTATVAGMGLDGHRDGYNVLYGDWSAKWFGDPQQRVIWHTQGGDRWGPATYVGYYNVLSTNAYYSNTSSPITGDPGHAADFYDWTSNTTSFDGSPLSVWHSFDTAVGVDVR